VCPPVEHAEPLARYILSKRWLYAEESPGGKIRTNAWLPHPHVELSVYRTDGWTVQEIDQKGVEIATQREANHRERELSNGRDYPADKRTFTYLGSGNIRASDVRDSGLDVLPDEPPHRHANIVGWPPLTQDKKRDIAAQMEYAMLLQRKSHFVPPNGSAVL
jgi:hypothetical protein